MYSSFSSWYILCFTRGKMHFSIAHRNKIIFTDPCSVVFSMLPLVYIYIWMLGVQVMNKTKQFKFSNSVSLKTLTKDIQYNFCNAYIWYSWLYMYFRRKLELNYRDCHRLNLSFHMAHRNIGLSQCCHIEFGDPIHLNLKK